MEIGRRHYPATSVFQNGPNWGNDVFIPMEWVIGGKDYVGQGWRMLVECLSVGRCISLPAMSVASGKLAAFTTGAYAASATSLVWPSASSKAWMKRLRASVAMPIRWTRHNAWR